MLSLQEQNHMRQNSVVAHQARLREQIRPNVHALVDGIHDLLDHWCNEHMPYVRGNSSLARTRAESIVVHAVREALLLKLYRPLPSSHAPVPTHHPHYALHDHV